MTGVLSVPNDPEPGSIGETIGDNDVAVVSVDSDGWTQTCAGIEDACERAARAVLGCDSLRARGPFGEVGISLSSDEAVRRLNRDYRAKDRPTNVLSFAANAPGIPGMIPPLGDIILGFSTVEAESRQAGKPLVHHAQHLVVHGCLHLLGYDHETAGDAEIMEALEVRILAGLGIPDPYDTPAAEEMEP